MAKKYYTLLIREDGKWAPQFGDYEFDNVRDEERDTYGNRHSFNYAPAKDRKIIATSCKQADINAAIAKLNGTRYASPAIQTFVDTWKTRC